MVQRRHGAQLSEKATTQPPNLDDVILCVAHVGVAWWINVVSFLILA